MMMPFYDLVNVTLNKSQIDWHITHFKRNFFCLYLLRDALCQQHELDG